VRASGLSLNSQVMAADLEKAANRLNGTGAFLSVQYLLKPAVGTDGVEADFQVKDTDQFLPAHFENVVWFTPEELKAKIHGGVPLYDGSLPTSGSMADDVVAILKQALVQKGLPNDIAYELQAEMGKPPKAYLFKVNDSTLKIGEIRFPGATRMDAAALQKPISPLRGMEYLNSTLEIAIKDSLTPVYEQRGFLKVAFGEIKPHLTKNGAVDIDIPVTEGEQYRLAGYSWAGNTLIAADELSKKITLHTGKPVDGILLTHDLNEARKLFGKFGREAAAITPSPVFASDTVTYSFAVVEGDLYHMGKLEIKAPDAQRKQLLQDRWKLPTGAPYDSTYVLQFAALMAPMFPDSSWKWVAIEHIDDPNKLVDVYIEARRK